MIYVFLADRFNLQLLFSDTILTGGDSASWYQVALHLKEDLLPKGRLFGWNLDNYFGYNNLLHYFVFPFFLIIALSTIVPLTIALKIISFIGILATPLAIYWSLKKLAYKNPVPLLGAWASIYFLFHEHFSIFGGNVLSTLAGEFCFSIAFALFILFLGNFTYGIQHRSRVISNSILLTLIGLSHAFVFFSAVLVPVYYLLRKSTFRKHLPYIILVYFIAFLLMAFWSLPMLADREFTSPIKMIWNFHSWQQFTKELGRFTIVMSVIAISLLGFRKLRTQHTLFYLYMLASSVFLYFIATSLKIPDIRFFPVWMFFSILLAIDLISLAIKNSLRPILARRLAVTCAILIGGSIIYSPTHESPDWFFWNYSGYESKNAFQNGTLDDIVLILKGGNTRGRIAFEHVDNNSEFGSDRIFENLPLFANRPTTEGIHYASGYLSKTITAMTGEYSLRSGGAEPIIISHPDVQRLREHFRLFNLTQIIVKSSEIKQMLRSSEDFELVGYAGNYEIFELTNYIPHYVEMLPHRPAFVTIDSSNANTAMRNWFRRSGKIDEVFVNSDDMPHKYQNIYFKNSIGILTSTGELSTNKTNKLKVTPIQEEKIDHLNIQFKTKGLGAPHIIKVAYSPNWKSANGEPIFKLSPGLMLIFPESTHVELRFERNIVEIVSLFLTLTGLSVILFLSNKDSQTLILLQERLSAYRTIQLTERLRLPTLAIAFIILLILSVQAYKEKQLIAVDYKMANQLMNEKKYQAAIQHYEKLTTPDMIAEYDRDEIPHAFLAQAQAYQKLNNNKKSYQALLDLKRHYPGWKSIDIVYELLAEHENQRGNHALAITYTKECERLSSYTQIRRNCGTDSSTTKGENP